MKKKGKLTADGLSLGLDDKDLDKIFYCVMMDHPEIFYVDGYRYTKLLRGEKITSMDMPIEVYLPIRNLIWYLKTTHRLMRQNELVFKRHWFRNHVMKPNVQPPILASVPVMISKEKHNLAIQP